MVAMVAMRAWTLLFVACIFGGASAALLKPPAPSPAPAPAAVATSSPSTLKAKAKPPPVERTPPPPATAILPPAPPIPGNEAPVSTETCTSLQGRITKEDKQLQSVSCQLLELSAGSPEGCDCRLIRTEATGGVCPYDCANTGVPGCTAGAALELGLKGLTKSEPVSLPKSPGSVLGEALLCSYFQYNARSADIAVTERQDTAAALATGRLRAMQMIRQADVEADAMAEAHANAIYAMTPAPFTLAPAFVMPDEMMQPTRLPTVAPGPTALLQRTSRSSKRQSHKHIYSSSEKIYSTESHYLGHIEVLEENLGGGKFLRTLMTDRVAQSEALLVCQTQDENFHGKNCQLSKTEVDPVEKAYLRNVIAGPLAFSQGKHWHGGPENLPQKHVTVLGFGAGTVPMFLLNHMEDVHVTAIEIDPKVLEVAFNFFGVPLPIHHQRFSAMRDNDVNSPGLKDKLIDRRCTADKRLCVRTQDGLEYLHGMPPNSIDILVIDCFGGDGSAPNWLKEGLPHLVLEAARTAEVVLVNEEDSGDTPEELAKRASRQKIWKDAGFSTVLSYGFDDDDLVPIRSKLCPGSDCGKWNRFLLAASPRARGVSDALAESSRLDKTLGLSATVKLQEILRNPLKNGS